jgi:hypothetical protein
LKTGYGGQNTTGRKGKKKGFAAFASRWGKIEREERGKEIGACMRGNKKRGVLVPLAACSLAERREPPRPWWTCAWEGGDAWS